LRPDFINSLRLFNWLKVFQLQEYV
jgi:hypothetical protein